ncbi:MAG: hypothetical protein PHF84_09330 [bacterium]|nr:hypothetical protein [bacterium]
MEEFKKIKDKDESSIIDFLKNYILDIDDLKRIEKSIKVDIYNENYVENKKFVENINLVYEVFRYSKNVEGIINLLEVIYKFEGIFNSDITIMIIKINKKYYTNIHVYVPVSRETLSKVKNDLKVLISDLKKQRKSKVLDFSENNLVVSEHNYIRNDRVAGKLIVPLYVKKKKMGELIFYYLDYRMARARE